VRLRIERGAGTERLRPIAGARAAPHRSEMPLPQVSCTLVSARAVSRCQAQGHGRAGPGCYGSATNWLRNARAFGVSSLTPSFCDLQNGSPVSVTATSTAPYSCGPPESPVQVPPKPSDGFCFVRRIPAFSALKPDTEYHRDASQGTPSWWMPYPTLVNVAPFSWIESSSPAVGSCTG